MELIKDTIDFERYRLLPDAANVRPASDYAQEVIDHLYAESNDPTGFLPWNKTHQNLRLRSGEVSIFAGVNGHGKSILLSQIYLGLLNQGEKACIASMEMMPKLTMLRMTRQAVGTVEPSPQAIRDFHTWTDNKLWLYDQVNTVDADRILGVGAYCAQELGCTHFLIDSLMKCGIGADDYNKQKYFMDSITALAKDTQMHISLVCHSRKRESENKAMDKFDVKGAGEITDMPDNVFTLWRNKKREVELKRHEQLQDHKVLDQPSALLRCDKQRNGDWEGTVALWWHPSGQYLSKDTTQAMRMIDDE